ncbi:hypothetical protein [Pseudomonas sp. KNUC1026]|uniref:hypothetical protein n=1 Tax=Pseudomonas sp. KNUC1026 TaxID=2893890 RepID=UPI001F3359CE|nr:hypothetical protein [Pseudomonas sp. KNUC1026]UFH49090.1 hypothetical protein LN139_19565 [Pseudomonas sp. KNUC1026]
MKKIYQVVVSDKHRSFTFEDNADDSVAWKDSDAKYVLDHFGTPMPAEKFPMRIAQDPAQAKKKSADVNILGADSIIVLSARALDILEEKLKPLGQFFPLHEPYIDYVGFHVTRVVENSVIWEMSKFREESGGRILYTPTLRAGVVAHEYLFMIPEDRTTLFFSDDFKKDVESHKLSGIDWTPVKIEV